MDSHELVERMMASMHSAASRLLVKSALNPMLWLCAIISLPCFILACLFSGSDELIKTWLLCIGAAPIAATIIGFFYFMILKSEKLQSEEFQIRHETLELIKEKGSSVEIVPSSLEAIANPIRQLSRGGG